MLLLAGAQARAGELLIETAYADDGALVVSYTPPEGVMELTRWNRSAPARDFWREQVKPLDDCATVDGDLIRLRAGCTTARLRVEPKLLTLNAVYQPAQPIAASGVIAYSGFYAVALPGHALRWRWLAPKDGYVLQQGRVQRAAAEQAIAEAAVTNSAAEGSKRDASWRELGAQQYVYLGRAPLVEFPGGAIVRDPALDDERVELIRATLLRDMRLLGAAYGQEPSGPVGVVTSVADLGSFHGDASEGRMMRLRLVPAEKNPDRDGLGLQAFVTHEAVHWWNMGVRRSDGERPWLHEGHADWATLLLMRQQGLWDDTTLRGQIENRVNRCLLARGDAPAAALPAGYSKNEDPYACGFALMLMAQAQQQARRHDAEDQRSPLVVLAGLHPRDAMLDTTGFATWADGAAGGPMHSLLQDGQQAFASGFTSRMQALGLAEAQPLADSDTNTRARIGARLLAELMRADCGGQVGFRMNYAGDFGFYKLDTLQCTSLRRGGEVMELDGHALIADPLAAWDAASADCAAGRALKIGYRQGEGSSMACPRDLPAIPARQLLRLQADALQRLGLTERK
ncbi:hypothetical protein [Pelomonas sp. KK5]|uniref:hypothetical protein n=1 Tax=Pelomonas sp. KK5 TaxID=1855730 RepID=UPI00117EE67F|nr:hypothetical protein [Pelomonas sp. KK5]